MTEYILSFDLGTTAVKTALFTDDGRLVAESTQEYELIVPSALVVEQDVEVYWDAVKSGVRAVLSSGSVAPEDIRCVGISAQGETLIPVGKDGNPVRPAIVWMDNRAHEEAEILAEAFPQSELLRRTGQVSMCATWPAAKILWMKRNEPGLFERVEKFLLIEDWLIHRLTGECVSEGSLLCSTAYWDIRTKQWWDEMLAYLGISASQLPEIREPGEAVGPIREEVARELGLSPGTVVATGGLDQACGAIGVGCIRPGAVTENIGAALAMCALVDRPFEDPEGKIPCFYFALPDMYMAHSFTTGGIVFRWFRDKFCQEELSVAERAGVDAYDLMTSEAANIPPGSEGLLVLPHLQGAGPPESNADAKGVFFGLTMRHTKAHMIRAIMESLCFAIRRLIDAFEGLGIKVDEIRSLGGGAKSELWLQMKADIAERPVIVSQKPQDAGCLGAAILAGVATGVWQTVDEAVDKMVRLASARAEPCVELAEKYARMYAAYTRLYEDLCGVFAASRSF
jgi:D-xylulose kinase